VRGGQIAGAVAVAPLVDGAQVAGAIAVARTVRGAQIAGAVGVAGDVDGAQIAGAMHLARDVRGAQIAGALNIARDVDGVQLGGATNVAARASTQIAGAVNVAGEAGIQVAGAVNVARRPRLQIGVVNVSDQPDVVAIGVVTIVRHGRTDLEATGDTGGAGAILLRHGGRRWHNVYGVGGLRAEDAAAADSTLGVGDDVWMYGLGMGPTWRRDALTIDVDAIAWQVNHGTWHDDDLSLLAQLRTTAAWQFGQLAAVGGLAVSTYIRSDAARPDVVARASVADTDATGVRIWPSAFAGVRF